MSQGAAISLATVAAVCSLIALVSAQQSRQMPQFVFAPPAKLLFNWDDVWEAGYPDSLAILSAGQKLTIRVHVTGDFGGGLKRILVFRCPSRSADDQLDMDSLATTVVTEQCSGSNNIAFNIRKPPPTSTASKESLSDDYTLTMAASQVSYQNVFNQYLRLRILIQHSGGELLSNSLSVWNLDPVGTFAAVQPVPSGYAGRSFLTQSAVSFLTGGEFGPGGMTSLQFIEPSMISLLTSAPAFLRARVNLGALLNFDASGCSYVQYERSTVFTSYDSKFDSRHTLLQKLVRLDMSTGLLWYSKCRLSNQIYSFYQGRLPPSIGLCLVVSVTGQMQPYFQVTTVRPRLTSPADFSYADCAAPTQKECSLVPNAVSNVTILAGMDYAALVCPIVCDDATVVYRFYANGQLLIPPTLSDWDAASGIRGVRISRSANIVELSPLNAPPGAYRCDAGGRSFTFNVRIVAVPSFATSNSAAAHPLPSRVFAVEGESVSYSCAAAYSGLQSVSLQAVFYVPATASDASGSGVTWTRHSLSSFQQLLGTRQSPLTVSFNESSSGVDRSLLSLNTVLQSMPARSQRPLDHRFVCEAGVTSPAEVASVFGLSYAASSSPSTIDLAAKSGSDIVHLRRPNRSSFLPGIEFNTCAKQRCHLGLGAEFKFGLSADYASYLNASGVEIVAYLRLDNFLLTDVPALMRPNVSSLTIVSQPSFIMTYRIYPFDTANSWSFEARRELEKRSTLTPVFNFRYRSGADAVGLRLDKSRYGAPTSALGEYDCRADALCFYSTDFDDKGPDGLLNFLSVQLNFKPPSHPVAEASFSYLIGIIVVCAVVILVLASLLVFLANRSPAKTYHLEEKEIGQGHDPKAEARDEKFKEYQRAEAAAGFANIAFSASTGQISYAAHQGTRESEL